VDGTFVDDVVSNDTEVVDINNASPSTYFRLNTALIKAGNFDWQSLGM
jgi:hypothetical protein